MFANKAVRPSTNNQGATSTGSLSMRKFLSRFMNNESGATAIEYGLIAAGIAVAIIAAVNSVGTSLNGTLSATAGAINMNRNIPTFFLFHLDK